MANKLWIIGIGPGSLKYIPPAALEKVYQADILLGGSRALKLFADHPGEKRLITGEVAGLIPYLHEQLADGRQIAVLVSGDPGFYSLLAFLRRHFASEQLEVIAGLSPFQVAFARLKEPWQGAVLESVHGRPLTGLLRYRGRKAVILTDHRHTARAVARFLKKQGYADQRVVVAQDVGGDQELILETTLFDLAEGEADFPSTILILLPAEDADEELAGQTGVFKYSLGLPDEVFKRAEVPMTKQEIRAITLAKAQLTPQSVVYDVGAGTGSISLEAARWVWQGMVYAIERQPAALDLLRENQYQLGAQNLILVAGEAPQAMTELPPADAVIIGGSGGKLREIVQVSRSKLRPSGRLVINAVTLETAVTAVEELERSGFTGVEAVSVAVTRWEKVQQSHLARALNPVWIIAGTRN
ncbi:MAG: precorrin-6y C5,15-methyltransferase (decarboxylating) subunit CbiE [Firmicutes bacterium]|nr:precorrin-6y C5,15-methyltransferase (decarboxylating) subunit CbiE [Bacillota bacterium]